jgi:hypothetical protein
VSNRDFSDPRYKAWRAAVRRRDGYRCKRCRSRRRLHVHHIRPWAEFPTLRFEPANGLTLCRACHRQMHGREADFAALCLSLLAGPQALVLRIRARSEDDHDEA